MQLNLKSSMIKITNMNDDYLLKIVQLEVLNQQDKNVKINLEHLLKEDLGLSSMNLVFLITEITNKLDLSILDFSDDELLNLKSVSDLVILLSAKMKIKN
jgi:acyl carrier protein